MLSREGVPVEVVGRPSMGEGRVPGGVGDGVWVREYDGEDGASGSVGTRERGMLRFRKAIVGGLVVVRRVGGEIMVEGLRYR